MTRFPALAAAMLASAAMVPSARAAVYGDAPACAAGSTTPALLVWLDGLKDRKGRIRVESTLGRGTTFTLRLPMATAPVIVTTQKAG